MNTKKLKDIFKEIINSKLQGTNSNELVLSFMKEVNSFTLVKESSDTSYLITNEDLGHEIYLQAATTVSFSADLLDKFQCAVIKEGTGDITFTGTYNGAGNTLATQYTGTKITKKNNKIFILGNLTTV